MIVLVSRFHLKLHDIVERRVVGGDVDKPVIRLRIIDAPAVLDDPCTVTGRRLDKMFLREIVPE